MPNNLKNYSLWLEEGEVHDPMLNLPPLVKDFAVNLTRTPGYGYEDWWCVPDRKTLDAALGYGSIADQNAAEQIERDQRKKSSKEKLLTDFFTLEYRKGSQLSNFHSDSHSYILIGFDAKEKRVLVSSRIQDRDEIAKAFDSALKKNFPTLYTSRKFGL